jgi:kinesin family protein 18/19
LHQEARDGGRAIINVLGNYPAGYSRTVILEDPHTTAADDYLRINKSKERRYTFDEAFGEYATQQEVYERTTKALIGGVLEGFNATVFAYGATSAGKTHTMLGTPNEPGIMMRTLLDLFSEVAGQREDRVFEVKCSFLEVYNENIRDLLRPDGDYLDIREDPVKGMCVAGISEVGGLESANEIMSLLHQGNRQRTTEATGANVTSSRSHAVLQVVVEQRDRTAGIVAQVNVGKLSMIDLAGSERASQTNNKGMRMIEGANINRSLLALGNCITALSSGVAFVPYRDSKMTRLLKDSLGGNCRTVMIANVSPCHLNYEDTHNTLKYASRAKNIKTKALRNVVSVNYHLSKYTEIIKELKGEIAELKTKLASAPEIEVPPDLELPADGQVNELDEAHAQSTNWKQELMANFEERVRIKRQLIDLAHVAQNQMVQKSRAQVGISQWESTQVPSQTASIADSPKTGEISPPMTAEMPQGIRDLQEQLQLIRKELANTEETTRGLEQQLVENTKIAQRLQEELPTRVPNKDMRAFLGLVYRIYVLEVENIDLQEMNDVTQPLLQQKELEAEALRLQIRMRDRMIEEQDRLLALEAEEIPPKPAGWEEIPAKPTRRPPSPPEDENESPHRDKFGNARNHRHGRARRARSTGPDERLSVENFVLPPLSPTSRGRFSCHDAPERGPPPLPPSVANASVAAPPGAPPLGHGGLLLSPSSQTDRVDQSVRTESSELPSLDIAGRGLGTALPSRSVTEDSDLALRRPPCLSPGGANREVLQYNDATRPLAHGADLVFAVEGQPAMPVDRRSPANSTNVGGPLQENRLRPTRSDAASRRKRKNRREREAARAAHRERLQQQLHIEAASLEKRYDLQQRGREREQHQEDLASDRGSSSDNTPNRRGRVHKEPTPTDASHGGYASAAGRRGIALEKLNRRMKASPGAPKNLS